MDRSWGWGRGGGIVWDLGPGEGQEQGHGPENFLGWGPGEPKGQGQGLEREQG